MMRTLEKVGYALGTYWQGYCATRRQFRGNDIRRVQDARLRRLVRFGAKNIKYYRETFAQAGLDPATILGVDDMPRLPLLTKQQLRRRFWDFMAPELPAACRVTRTSGSTGIPVCLLSDRYSRIFNSAAVIRYRRALGVPLAGRPIVVVLKTEHDPYARPAKWTFVQGLHKTYYLNPYIESSESVNHVRHLAGRLRRPVLSGIPSSLRVLAYKIRDGIFPALRPSVLLTRGEMLLPQVRDLLESTFDAPVSDSYACTEARDVAWQCRATGGYHINADNVVVEIVRDDQPAPVGQIGEVVLTDLNRLAMPIIRYKNGDLARLASERCPCGCKLPLIAEIIGRTGQDCRLPNGKTILWNQLKSLMTHQQIRQFQIVQEASGNFLIRYVPEKHAEITAIDNLLMCRFRNLLGHGIGVQIQKTGALPPASSGKTKLVVSHYEAPNLAAVGTD